MLLPEPRTKVGALASTQTRRVRCQLGGVGHDYVGIGRTADAYGGVSRERFVTLERGYALERSQQRGVGHARTPRVSGQTGMREQ